MKRLTGYVAFSLLAVLLVRLPVATASTPAGWGRVNMEGAILDTACAIEAGSRDQSIEMSTLPLSQIIRDGQGLTKPFTIRLVNCVLSRATAGLPDWQRFQVTFDGDGRNGLFQVHGEARGVALQITDARGNIALPGKPLPMSDVNPGNMDLNYFLRLVGDQNVLRVGEYYSAVRFKLDYY
ncbi:type 1 fimbrial protein [Serratia inhibens]|uniref:Type 1 fimbrial protein n=1 Tax=Serratia inhibens TaxID=2338073 RepID=A0AA93BVP4_9GAMM|nr:fimbrial protein [Serratia inhibens]RJF53301.1 type 1 fimbrial protein [Serratia inhibens]